MMARCFYYRRSFEHDAYGRGDILPCPVQQQFHCREWWSTQMMCSVCGRWVAASCGDLVWCFWEWSVVLMWDAGKCLVKEVEVLKNLKLAILLFRPNPIRQLFPLPKKAIMAAPLASYHRNTLSCSHSFNHADRQHHRSSRSHWFNHGVKKSLGATCRCWMSS